MTNTQFVKTMISGLAFMLGCTTAGGAWGVSKGIVKHLPAEYATGFLTVAIICAVVIVAVWAFIKEPKTN